MNAQPLDHRVLGRELGIYATDARVGPGLPLWLPDGGIVRAELERLAAQEAARSGCLPVYSPVLAKRELFEASGHLDKFAEDMFDGGAGGDDALVLRPANCPHHAMIYAARPHSFRDLPVRYWELGAMFRSERSGVLTGLSRVRQINLDDTHVFCAPEQAGSEVVAALDSIRRCYRMLGIEIAGYRLSVRDASDGYLGSPQQWQLAQDQLERALIDRGLKYRRAAGEAAFYGPKIDVQVLDASGREESASTVQFDFNQPERFDLTYTGSDGKQHRPVMIHRGVVGSMERMVAFLLERHQGRLPPWLAPVQVMLLPVGPDQDVAVEAFARELRGDVRPGEARSGEGGPGAAQSGDSGPGDSGSGDGVRVLVSAEGSLGARIRMARKRRVPWIVVIGPEEAAAGEVSVSVPALDEQARMAPAAFIESVQQIIAARDPLPGRLG